jgi:error-prone DNA polymerase
MQPSYAELHCISNFSFLRGASHPEEMVERALALGYTGLAITDECSFAGAVRAHLALREARSELAAAHEFRLIHGTEIRLTDGPHLVLLAQTRTGYGNLSELITLARRAAPKGEYRLTAADLAAQAHLLEDTLALLVPSFAPGGATEGMPSEARNAKAGIDVDKIELDACWLRQLLPGRTWIACELNRGPDDAAWLAALQQASSRAGVPLVAAGAVHMHVRSRKKLQDALTAVRLRTPLAQCGRKLAPNAEQYLRPLYRLGRIYPAELLAQTLAIAERCRFSLDELRYEYPDEIVPSGHTPASFLRSVTWQGAAVRYPQGVPDKVRALIEHELALIGKLHYEPYFLTVYDVVRFARERRILCQGRGSAANSAVCYCLGITEVDPDRISVLFERFVSGERNEPPDIDVDFEHQRREEVMQYVYAKYGRHRAALTAALHTYRPRGALRDLGKALGLSLDQVDRLAKSMSWWDGSRIRPELLAQAGFDADNPVIAQVVELAHTLIGFPRHLSQHSGGFVIAKQSLSRLVPIENAAMADRTVIQWDKDDLDALGLLKIDVLALGMLTCVRRALDHLNTFNGTSLRMQDIPAEDPAVYRMLCRGDSLGVFQVESRAQMNMLPRLRPERFYDLVIETAIVRPGPIQGGMVHPYLRRRQGLEPVTYPSEAVRSVLERTLGVSIFQEQVMQLAVVAAGFTPGESDRLRRAMAAWKRKGGLGPFRDRLIAGMLARGTSREYAEQIFQQIQGFGEYGFPESHAASFALLVYDSSWLKCHQPAAFCAALLDSQPLGFYAPAQIVRDAMNHGVTVRPVCVVSSHWYCTLEPCVAEPGKAGVAAHHHPLPDPLPQAGEGELRLSPFSREAGEGELRLSPFSREAGEGELRLSPFSREAGEGELRLSPLSREAGEGLGERVGAKASQPAVRLGLMQVSGLSEAAGQRIVEARRQAAFSDVHDLAHRAQLDRGDMARLAAADALAQLAGHRRDALWGVLGLDSGALRRAPLTAALPVAERQVELLAPTEGQDIVADYEAIGLTLRRHPLAPLRERLDRMRLWTARRIGEARHQQRVRTTGIVTCRQRPGTASGVTFVTLEDETGWINVVVWRATAERFRRELLASTLLTVYGHVERIDAPDCAVIHVIAARLVDHSTLLGGLTVDSHDFR